MTTPPTNDEQWLDNRKCRYCGEVKPLTDFQKSKTCTSGYRYRCKACTNAIIRKVYENDPTKKLAKNRTYKNSHADQIREKAYARRNIFKTKANQAVNNAIAAGKLFKKPCSECGNPIADFHHNNGYDKENWFTGVWLCRKHHLGLHKQLRWQNEPRRLSALKASEETI